MVMYSESTMLSDLLSRLQTGQIPSKYDREFILSRSDSNKPSTMAQYNFLLDLYNKYIVVQAGDMQVLRDYNYGDGKQ